MDQQDQQDRRVWMAPLDQGDHKEYRDHHAMLVQSTIEASNLCDTSRVEVHTMCRPMIAW